MVRSDPCLLVETSVAWRLHDGLSQPRSELHDPVDLAWLTHSLNQLYMCTPHCRCMCIIVSTWLGGIYHEYTK